MENNPNYTVVGLFVILLLGAIIMSIIWLSSGFTLTGYRTYMIYMKESVSGLNMDSAVEFNGVNVGNVKNISINRVNSEYVNVLIRVNKNTPINRGTEASLNTRGFTGMAFITLKDTGVDKRPLPILKNQKYPVIATSKTSFIRLDAAMATLTRNFTIIAKSIEAVLDTENLQSIKKTLLHMEDLTATLAVSSKQLDSVLANTNEVTLQMTPLLKQGSSTMRALQIQLIPVAIRTLSNLENVTRTLSEVAVELKENPSILIKGVDRSKLVGPGERV